MLNTATFIGCELPFLNFACHDHGSMLTEKHEEVVRAESPLSLVGTTLAKQFELLTTFSQLFFNLRLRSRVSEIFLAAKKPHMKANG